VTAIEQAVEHAGNAGLRYVTDRAPGIRRVAENGGFAYLRPDGKPVRDEATLARIKSLAIPPAYADVWICPHPDGHLQATGRDARGRKQYRYHARWREERDSNKYERLSAFAKTLPALRRAVDRDLAKPGMPREKVLAAVVALLETTLIRIGNEEYARANGSYGLTTLRNRHARVRGATLRFEFAGKSGVRHRVDLHDRRIARVVARCRDLPGQQLFTYLDDEGNAVPIDSSDVNEYIRSICGEDFSAKDFRTWLATVHCAGWLRANPGDTRAERERRVVEAIKFVAQRLRNTPAVCRKCYVHPAIIERYLELGKLPAFSSRSTALDAEEGAVASLLRRAARASQS
jgi:DNA topoisomerase-1